MHASLVEIHGSARLLDFDGLPEGHVNLEIFGLVHLNHAAGFLHSNSGVKMS